VNEDECVWYYNISEPWANDINEGERTKESEKQQGGVREAEESTRRAGFESRLLI